MARKVDKINTYSILVGKSAGKKPLGRPKLRGEDEVKRVLKKEDGRGRLEWCGDSGLGKVAGFCENGSEHSGFMKCREFD